MVPPEDWNAIEAELAAVFVRFLNRVRASA
jgi:hypothetical protein